MKAYVPDLFAGSVSPDPQHDHSFARLEAWISEGRLIEIQTTMTVCALHCMWDAAWQRGQDAAARLNQFADKLEERKRKATRLDKLRLQNVIGRAQRLANCAAGFAEYAFISAQDKFNETLPLDDKQREIFWLDVGDRPGIEYTWELTLQQVIDHLKPLSFE